MSPLSKALNNAIPCVVCCLHRRWVNKPKTYNQEIHSHMQLTRQAGSGS